MIAVDCSAIFPTVAKIKGKKGMMKTVQANSGERFAFFIKKEKIICVIVEITKVTKSQGKRPLKCVQMLVLK
ncbi:MAG: hypothetical protein QJQ54_02805 [Mollicutes bacterium]|nr:MAG: hypothetical protein QJQ54_02805 [Mollicutes bacterium]